jgi:hypothetical protein
MSNPHITRIDNLYGINPEVKPGDVYRFQCDVSTRAGHVHPKDSFLTVLDSTTRCRHQEISASGKNWVCSSQFGTSEWATLEQCISRGLLVRHPDGEVLPIRP